MLCLRRTSANLIRSAARNRPYCCPVPSAERYAFWSGPYRCPCQGHLLPQVDLLPIPPYTVFRMVAPTSILPEPASSRLRPARLLVLTICALALLIFAGGLPAVYHHALVLAQAY